MTLFLIFLAVVVIPGMTWCLWRREVRLQREKQAFQQRLDQVLRGY